MKSFTFILQDPNKKYPQTHRFCAASIISATNTIMQGKNLQGLTIQEAYCGSKRGKITQMGFISYEYLEGKVVEATVKSTEEPVQAMEFGGLLGEVDEQCGNKRVTD
jgi:hypothetical protein